MSGQRSSVFPAVDQVRRFVTGGSAQGSVDEYGPRSSNYASQSYPATNNAYGSNNYATNSNYGSNNNYGSNSNYGSTNYGSNSNYGTNSNYGSNSDQGVQGYSGSRSGSTGTGYLGAPRDSGDQQYPYTRYANNQSSGFSPQGGGFGRGSSGQRGANNINSISSQTSGWPYQQLLNEYYNPRDPNRNFGFGEGTEYINSPTLPPSIAAYFRNGEVLDSSQTGPRCDANKPRLPSKLGAERLWNLAYAAFFTDPSMCRQRGPPGGGRGGPPGGPVRQGPPPDEVKDPSRPDINFPAIQDPRKCLDPVKHANLGTCGDLNDTLAVESVYLKRAVGAGLSLVVTNGIPGHCYSRGIDGGLACEAFFAILVPDRPKLTNRFKAFEGGGKIGVTVDGAMLAGHAFEFLHGKCDVVVPIQRWNFGPCDGHASGDCKYHIHKVPSCMAGFNDCALLGHMVDGVPIYGKCTVRQPNGRLLRLRSCYRRRSGRNGCDTSHYEFRKGPDCQLDEANGFYFPFAAVSASGRSRFAPGTYGYFFTAEYPFLNPGYYGEKQKSCELDARDAARAPQAPMNFYGPTEGAAMVGSGSVAGFAPRPGQGAYGLRTSNLPSPQGANPSDRYASFGPTQSSLRAQSSSQYPPYHN